MDDLASKINHIKWLNKMGVDFYLSENPQTKNTVETKTLPLAKNHQPLNLMDSQGTNNSISIARNLADQSNSLEDLRIKVSSFEECKLKILAKNTVFADGSPSSKVMLIGEAPGASEDEAGIPFCGESGKLLDNMISTIGLSRQTNAYITNTIFWRPPANRTPTQEEIDMCRPFVEKHIALLQPKLIILVGSTAATSLLGKHAGVSKIRQEYFGYTNRYLDHAIPTTAIFHPAYLLRQPLQKKTAWYDLIKIQQFLTERVL
jgi:DNA polymerase